MISSTYLTKMLKSGKTLRPRYSGLQKENLDDSFVSLGEDGWELGAITGEFAILKKRVGQVSLPLYGAGRLCGYIVYDPIYSLYLVYDSY